MEIGKTIILLNSYNLYESLYDALNQYYYEFAGQKYVDLGLGTHRVKCLVHENFRLIVIAEKEAVYDTKRFPIPLINRLEKHFLNAANMLDDTQLLLRNQLDDWSKQFLNASSEGYNKMKNSDVFVGFHEDTTSSLILFLSEQINTQFSFNMNFSKNNNQNTMMNMEYEEEKNQSLTSTSDSQSASKDIIYLAKKILIRCATPDSIIRAYSAKRLNKTG